MPDNDRKGGPWVMSPRGKRWYLLDPRPEDFDIKDIAHCLSRLNRFNGAVDYTVAEHSMAVSRILTEVWSRPDLALQGLLHDATEAVIGDIVSPLKAILPEIRDIEDRLWRVIAERFGLPTEIDPLVSRVDQELAAVEGYQLFDSCAPLENKWWVLTTFGPSCDPIRRSGVRKLHGQYQDAHEVRIAFLDEYRYLTRGADDA